MKMFRASLVTALAVVATTTVFGQGMFGGGMPSFGERNLAKIFGANQGFTAVGDFTIDSAKGDSMQMEMNYAFSKGSIRTEMDMSKMKGKGMDRGAAAQMKQMGMDRVVMIHQRDGQKTYMVYPGLKSYCEVTGRPTATEKKENMPKVDVTKLGNEVVDTHPCTKNKITVTGDDGRPHEILAWQAGDLNDFPIKTEMTVDGSKVTTRFRDIKLTPPAESEFQPPAGFQRYGSMQEMMMGSMNRMMEQQMGGGQGHPRRGGGDE